MQVGETDGISKAETREDIKDRLKIYYDYFTLYQMREIEDCRKNLERKD